MRKVRVTAFMHRGMADLGMEWRFPACGAGEGPLEAAPRFGAAARRTKPWPPGLAFLKADR
jgi:hypothetical protein